MDRIVTSNRSKPRERIRVLQANTAKTYTCFNAIINNAIQGCYDIILIQEPPPVFQIRTSEGIRYYFNPTLGPNVTNIIVIINKLLVVNLVSNPSHLVTIVDLPAHGVRLVNAYCPPRHPIEEIISTVENIITEDTIISGDFNARSVAWADTCTNSRGNKLLSFANKHSLFILHSTETPSFQVARGGKVFESNIDITLVTPSLVALVTDWDLAPHDIASDHHPINFTIFGRTSDYPKIDPSTRKRWKLSEVDWQCFRAILSLNTPEIDSTMSTASSLDCWLSKFYNRVNHSVSAAGGQESKQGKISPFPWWNEEIDNLCETLRKARRRKMRASPRSKKLFYTWIGNLIIKIRDRIDTARKQYWAEFFTTATPDTAWASYYKVIKARQKTPLTKRLEIDDTVVTGDQNLARYFVNYFFGPELPDTGLGAPSSDPPNSTSHCLQPNELINTSELKYAIGTFGQKKAPGKDGLTMEIIKNFPDQTINSLCMFFNECLRASYFPKDFKRSLTVLIPKSGVPDSSPKAVRPIGLLPYLGKIFEKLILTKLDAWLATTLSRRQYGFMRGKSTKDALAVALKQISLNTENKKASLLVSFDIQGAFDCVRWSDILKILKRRNCPENYQSLIDSYLQDRYTELVFGNATAEIKNHRGTVQGSCLGPTLWNLIINEFLLKVPTDSSVTIIAYADDITMLLGLGKTSYETDMNALAAEMARLEQWSQEFSLKFSINKTKCLWMPGRLKTIARPTVTFNQQSLVFEKSIKILGLHIDEKLNWSTHINRTISSICGLIFSSKSSLGWPRPGLSLLRLIHNAVLIPKITYGSDLYIRHLRAKEINAITSLHRRILIFISGAYKTTPYSSLCLICDVDPVIFTMERLATERLVFHGETNILDLPGDREIERKVSQQFSYNSVQIPRAIGHPIGENQQHLICTNEQSTIYCYTDGSKSEEGTGFGACFFNHEGSLIDEICEPLFSYSSIFQAESLALLFSVRRLAKLRRLGYVAARIYTDSQSLYSALKSYCSQSDIIEETRSIVNSLIESGFNIKIHWIKAHVNYTGNEYADFLAKKATTSHKKVLYTAIPRSFIKKRIKEMIKEKILTWYTENKSKSFLIDKLIPGWMPTRGLDLNRSAIWLITGHGPFMDYLKRFHLSTSPECHCQFIKGDNHHYAKDCEIFRSERLLLTSEYNLGEEQFRKSIVYSLGNAEVSTFNTVSHQIISKLNKLNRSNG